MKTYNVCLIKKVLLVIFQVFFLSISASAQTKPKMDILVESLNNDATQCNIYKSDFITSAILIMRNNGIIYEKDNTFLAPFLYISPNILHLKSENRCLYGLNIQIQVLGMPMNRFGFSTRTMEDIVICRKSMSGISNQINASTSIINEFERMFKQCLSQIDY